LTKNIIRGNQGIIILFNSRYKRRWVNVIFQQDKNHIIAVFLKIKFMCNSFTNTQKHIPNKYTDTYTIFVLFDLEKQGEGQSSYSIDEQSDTHSSLYPKYSLKISLIQCFGPWSIHHLQREIPHQNEGAY